MLKASVGTENPVNTLPPGVASPVLTMVESAPPSPVKMPLPPAYVPRKATVLPLIVGSRTESNVPPSGVESPFLAIVVSGPPAPVKIPSWLPATPRNATVGPLRS